MLRLKGRGLPEKTGGHGDLYAHVRVMLPEGGDPELEALMRKRALIAASGRALPYARLKASCACAIGNPRVFRVRRMPIWRLVRA